MTAQFRATTSNPDNWWASPVHETRLLYHSSEPPPPRCYLISLFWGTLHYIVLTWGDLLEDSPPYCGKEVCAHQWSEELCWRKHKLLVQPPMPDRSKGRGQMKCSPWSSRLGVGHGTNDPAPEKCAVTKAWGRLKPTQSCSANKKNMGGEKLPVASSTQTTTASTPFSTLATAKTLRTDRVKAF
jgi:hypothetical protein